MDTLAASFQAPKVRDGEPLGTITLIAVSSGVLVACLLLIVITSMVYKKPQKKCKDDKSKPIQGRKRCFTNVAFAIDEDLPPTHLSIISHTKKPFDDPPSPNYRVGVV